MKHTILMALMFLLTLSLNAQNRSSKREKPKPVKTLYKSDSKTIATTNLEEEICFKFLSEKDASADIYGIILFKDKAAVRKFFNKASEIQSASADQSLDMKEYVVNEGEVKLVKSGANTYIHAGSRYTTITQPVLDRILKKIRS